MSLMRAESHAAFTKTDRPVVKYDTYKLSPMKEGKCSPKGTESSGDAVVKALGKASHVYFH